MDSSGAAHEGPRQSGSRDGHDACGRSRSRRRSADREARSWARSAARPSLEWHFEATIDGWAPSLNVSLGVRNLPSFPAYANIFQLLPHLEGYLPVSFVAYNDNFIVGADLLWVRLGLLKGGPGPFSVNAGVTINETVATAYGGVRIPTANPDWRVYATLGARYFNLDGSIELHRPLAVFPVSHRRGSSGLTRSSE